MDVLVLNAAYQPVGISTWQDAMTKLYSLKANERVEIVSTYKERVIKTASGDLPMPMVVRHVKFRVHKNKGVRFGRENVWARDRGRCQYCGIQVPKNSYTYDHVIPRAHGGKTSWDNIVTACARCNGKKRDRTPAEAKMRLRSIPVKPEKLPDEFKSAIRYKEGMPDEWKVWLGADYWHGGTEESPE
jgi:5-methylcytosine-specific restriction endonuclease McrA